MTAERRKLPAGAIERAMRLSVVDGVLWAFMVGLSETYFSAEAVRLGATPLELSLVIALPLIVGALGATLVVRLLRAWPRRRALVVLCASAQVGTLLGLAALARAGSLTPALLILLASAYQVAGQGSGVAWSSWYGDLVPAARRGSFFAARGRLVHIATFVGIVAAGVILDRMEPPIGDGAVTGGGGFALMFALAAGFRALSVVVLSVSPEPRAHLLHAQGRLRRFFETRRGRNARHLLWTSGCFQCAVYTTAPYFAPFMLENLQLGYLEYMIAIATQVVAKVAAIHVWGRMVDQHGARRAYLTSLVLAALVPFYWVFVGGFGGVLLAQAMSGAAWGGYEVAQFSLVLASTVKRTRTLVFATLGVGNGLGQVSGSLLGWSLFSLGGYRFLFGASTVLRMSVALLLPRRIVELRPAPDAREPLLLRVLGFRPGPGVVHRPIPVPGEGESEPR